MPTQPWQAAMLQAIQAISGMGGGTLYDGTRLAPAAAAPLAASTTVTSVLVQADPDNTLPVFVGNATSQSMQLVPGQGETLPVNDPSIIYIRSAGGAERVNWHAVGE